MLHKSFCSCSAQEMFAGIIDLELFIYRVGPDTASKGVIHMPLTSSPRGGGRGRGFQMMTIDDKVEGGILANDDVITETLFFGKFLGFSKEFSKNLQNQGKSSEVFLKCVLVHRQVLGHRFHMSTFCSSRQSMGLCLSRQMTDTQSANHPSVPRQHHYELVD